MNQQGSHPFAAHLVPFFTWAGVMILLSVLEMFWILPRSVYPWSYALKSILCALLFFWYRPWRFYPTFRLRNLGLALVVGILVAFLWIFPETPFCASLFPRFQDFYFRWLILPFGGFPSYVDPSIFPELPAGHPSWAFSIQEAGWGLALAKLAGSSLVIAVLEEFFFRGFCSRWLQKNTFWTVPLTYFDLRSFLIILFFFGFQHDRWLAGCMAGFFYGWLTVRTGDLWASAIAHGITNFLLGLYILKTAQYGFW